MNIAILCDGEFPCNSYPLRKLMDADILICCDNSLLQVINNNLQRVPNYIIGDMDSLSKTLQDKYKEIIIKSNCQETNDQTKAFSFALGLLDSACNNTISFIGATGKREDHTLGNISLLVDYASVGNCIAPFNNTVPANVNIEMITDYGVFKPFFNSFTYHTSIGTQISIFSFDNSLRIKSNGLLYKTDNVVFDLWWKATLNQASSNIITLEFNHPSKILLFENF